MFHVQIRVCQLSYFRESALTCRIWSSHSGGYEEFYHVGYNAMLAVWNPADILEEHVADCLENVAASTCHNPVGLHGLLQE
jgi:hypothetical protein